jgi:hypothetical protein
MKNRKAFVFGLFALALVLALMVASCEALLGSAFGTGGGDDPVPDMGGDDVYRLAEKINEANVEKNRTQVADSGDDIWMEFWVSESVMAEFDNAIEKAQNTLNMVSQNPQQYNQVINEAVQDLDSAIRSFTSARHSR